MGTLDRAYIKMHRKVVSTAMHDIVAGYREDRMNAFEWLTSPSEVEFSFRWYCNAFTELGIPSYDPDRIARGARSLLLRRLIDGVTTRELVAEGQKLLRHKQRKPKPTRTQDIATRLAREGRLSTSELCRLAGISLNRASGYISYQKKLGRLVLDHVEPTVRGPKRKVWRLK